MAGTLDESSHQQSNVAFRDKLLRAPLARMESFAEVDDEQDEVMTCHWTVLLCIWLQMVSGWELHET